MIRKWYQVHHRWHPSCILLLDLMIYLKIVKQCKHMANDDCPETASETCFQKKNRYMLILRSKNSPNSPCILVYIFQMEKFSLKFGNLVYSENHAKS